MKAILIKSIAILAIVLRGANRDDFHVRPFRTGYRLSVSFDVNFITNK